MIHRHVLDHYPAARPAGDPFVASFTPWESVGGVRGLRFRRLGWMHDPRGCLVEVARESNVGTLAQAYITTTRRDVIKGFHLHVTPSGGCALDAQTDRFLPLGGVTLFVFYDLRSDKDGRFHELVVDATRDTFLIEVPPGVAHGWIAIGNTESVVLNVPSVEYTGEQERRCNPHGPVEPSGPRYDWRRNRDG